MTAEGDSRLRLAARSFALAALLGVAARPAWCYEQATHAALTREAYARARINPAISNLAMDLGLQEAQNLSLGDNYIDIGPSGAVARAASPSTFSNFSSQKINDVNQRSSFKPTLDSLAGWLMLGAIREDDVPFDPHALENTPQDEPGGPFIRVFHHFYDPFNDRPLTTTVQLGYRAPDWALQTGLVAVDSGRETSNHFTIGLAREAMWRALTLKKIESSGVFTDLGSSIASQDEDMHRQRLRLSYWATTFRALGDVLHLLQDMAQPQHTRNDPHSGLGCASGWCAAGHASYFEKFIDAKATGANIFRLRERFYGAPIAPDAIEQVAVTGLLYSGYPSVSFPTYRDYFVTRTLTGSPLGSGLANYSNQGFFSAGTNLNKGSGFPSPPTNANALPDQVIADGSATDAAGAPLPGSLILKIGGVQDNLNSSQSASGVRLSAYGAFDQFMQPTGNRQFSLNHYNYDDQARLLIPRAVAYSTGFLDYFFRGVLDINLPAAGAYAVIDHTIDGCEITCGFRKVKLKLKNSTPTETLSNGFFVAVVKFYRNNSYARDLSGEPGGSNFTDWEARSWSEEILVSDKVDIATVSSAQLAPNGEAELSFAFSKPIPINATDIYLQVVFRGQLGNETDAVVVATKNISEPNYVAIVNDYDYTYNYVTDTFQSVAPDPQTQTITQIDVKLGNATTPIATLPNLGVRGYAQLAFLTDIGGSGTEKIMIDLNAPGFGPWIALDLPVATFDSPGATVYDRTRHVTKYRGMWSDYRFDLFQGSRYGTDACAPLDPGRVCTSAGLTSITPANAVAWTINFP